MRISNSNEASMLYIQEFVPHEYCDLQMLVLKQHGSVRNTCSLRRQIITLGAEFAVEFLFEIKRIDARTAYVWAMN